MITFPFYFFHLLVKLTSFLVQFSLSFKVFAGQSSLEVQHVSLEFFFFFLHDFSYNALEGWNA